MELPCSIRRGASVQYGVGDPTRKVRPWNAVVLRAQQWPARFGPEGHGCLRCRAIAYKARTPLLQKSPPSFARLALVWHKLHKEFGRAVALAEELRATSDSMA